MTLTGMFVSADNTVKELREVESFDAIRVSSGIDVYLFQGEEEKVIVECDDDMQKCIKVTVKNGTLRCNSECRIKRRGDVNIYVNYKYINDIDVNSGSNVYSETVIKSNSMRLSANSGSEIKLNIESSSIKCDAGSGSNVELKGKTEELDCQANSGSNIKAKDLKTENGRVEANNGSNIDVWIEKRAYTEANSGGRIDCYGAAPMIDRHCNSGGKVTLKN